MSKLVLSIDAKFYVDEATAYALPAWNEVRNTRDATLSLESTEFDVSTRGGGAFSATIATMIGATFDFSMNWDKDDPIFIMIRNAFLAREGLNMAIMDGDIETAGSEGLRAVMMISKFTRNEKLPEALTVDVSVKPTYFPESPAEWLIIT